MRICLVNVVLDAGLKSPEVILERYWHPLRLAAALAELGHEVAVLQVATHDATRNVGATRVRLIRENDMRRSGSGYSYSRHPRHTLAMLARDCPEVVHFHGLTLTEPLRRIAQFCRDHRIPLTASYHGGLPPRRPLLRLRQRRALAGVSRFAFTTRSHAEPWLRAGITEDPARVCEVMEVSSPFHGLPRAHARQRLGLCGDPVFVWAGRLCALKDPATALKGFSRITRSWDTAHLYMAFSSAELLGDVEALIEAEDLTGKVTLLGRLPHRDMEALFSGGDFFLQASHREWGGNSLLEAMSCGAIPVVTDIPSFRTMTAEGRLGILFPVGDDRALAEKVLRLAPSGLPSLSAAVSRHFRNHLSYPALARNYDRMFAAARAELEQR